MSPFVRQNPKVFDDVQSIMRSLYAQHKTKDRTLRVVVLEQQLYPTLIAIKNNITTINLNKKTLTIEEINELFTDTHTKVELAKSMLYISFSLNMFTLEFFRNTDSKLQEISMQLYGWQKNLK